MVLLWWSNPLSLSLSLSLSQGKHYISLRRSYDELSLFKRKRWFWPSLWLQMKETFELNFIEVEIDFSDRKECHTNSVKFANLIGRSLSTDQQIANLIGWGNQRTLIYFVRGSITVQLTSCLTGLDLAKQVNLLIVWIQQSSWIQTNQTGSQPYTDTSPYKVSQCFLVEDYQVIHN